MAKKPKKSTKKADKDTKIQEEKKTETKQKSTKSSDSKPKYEFNLSDGLTYHDFVGIFIIIGVFIWKILKIILYPVFWVYYQNVRLYRFIRASGQQRVMTNDEQLFFESVPVVFMSTGVVGGIIIGLLVGLQVNLRLSEFFSKLGENIGEIFGPISGFIKWLWNDVILTILKWIYDISGSIYNVFRDWYNQNPFVALLILVGLGIAIVILWITINEKFGLTIVQFLHRIADILFGTPQRMYARAVTIYQRFNHGVTAFLVGETRLRTRTQEFFKKSLMYTSILAIWTFLAGLYINIKFFPSDKDIANQVVFSAVVLLVAGFVCGTIIFALITRYFDLMNRKKYIAPEFIANPRTPTTTTTVEEEKEYE